MPVIPAFHSLDGGLKGKESTAHLRKQALKERNVLDHVIGKRAELGMGRVAGQHADAQACPASASAVHAALKNGVTEQ